MDLSGCTLSLTLISSPPMSHLKLGSGLAPVATQSTSIALLPSVPSFDTMVGVLDCSPLTLRVELAQISQ